MKIRLKRVDKLGLWTGIWIAYEGDEEMREIHILEDPTLREMTDYTFKQSTQDSDKAGTLFYQVVMPDGTVIGYTTLVLEPARILFTFGLNINYRKKEILQGWMKAIERHLGYSYMLTLRLSNTRAVNFFRKYGFNVKEDQPNKQYILWRRAQ